MTDLDIRRPDRQPYELGDRYRTGSGPVVLTGVQAIARALVEQHERDARAGLRVATFVSGYQGSPLGGVDRMLAAMPDVLAAHDITFVPGLNEELAATSVWGSQADLPMGTATHDGVVGVWYGKGPGLDRATDALRHANMYGANPRGGMLLLVGDDPASKSSTVPAVSERSLAALGIPVLFPRNAHEIVTMAMHGVAMSRASGCVVALKIVADVADGAWSVDGSDVDIDIVIPQVHWEGRPFVYRQRPMAAPATASTPRLTSTDPVPRSCAPTVPPTGSTSSNSIHPMRPSGSRPRERHSTPCGRRSRSGRRRLRAPPGRYKAVADRHAHPAGARHRRTFAEGLEEILVVEDKTAFVETQVREILYGRAGAPRIIGKKDATGRLLIPADGELTAGRLLAPLRRVLDGRLELKKPPPPAFAGSASRQTRRVLLQWLPAQSLDRSA